MARIKYILEYTWLRSLMGPYEDFWKMTEDALIFACKTPNLLCESSIHNRLIEAYLCLDPYPEIRQALSALSNYTPGECWARRNFCYYHQRR